MKLIRTHLVLVFISIFLLILAPLTWGETTLEGELTTGLSIASSNCKVEKGSIVCTDEPSDDATTPYFFEQLLDLELSGFFGPGDQLRSLSEFYHPYAPFSGLTFQGFTAETMIGEIASVEGELVFSPNITLYTFSDKRTESYGGNFPRLAFRRYKSSIEFGLVGLTAGTTLILDNWQDTPEDKPDIKSGVIFEVSGEMENEVELEMETKLGVKSGVTCFGNCLGPLKLQQNAVQADMGFEEFLVSADKFSIKDIELSLSSKFSSDNGFNNLTVKGSRTWDYMDTDITLASSVVVTSNSFLPFTGTSFTWSADPLILSVYFDETYKLSNAAQSIQFTPDLSELNIEGLNGSSQALLGEMMNLNLTVPTGPIDFTGALRFRFVGGRYNFDAGLVRAQLSQDPLSAEAICAFRDQSRIIKLETSLDF